MRRVVMEQHEPPRAHGRGEVDSAADARMAPAESLVVLLVEVLRVVEKQVDALRDRAAGDPVAAPVVEVARQGRLVVGQVGNARAVRVDPVADRGARVDDQAGAQLRGADRPRRVRDVVERDLCRRVLQVDRKERRREGLLIRSLSPSTGERGPQRSIVVRGSNSGAKKRSPSRWSRWRCVRRSVTWRTSRAASSAPSSRMPVPASRMKTESSASEISTRDVFPPQRDGLRAGRGDRAAAAPDHYAHEPEPTLATKSPQSPRTRLSGRRAGTP